MAEADASEAPSIVASLRAECRARDVEITELRVSLAAARHLAAVRKDLIDTLIAVHEAEKTCNG